MSTTNVPVGTATVAGYSGTILGAIAAVLTLIFPNVDQQSIALVVSSVFAIVSFIVTQVGRYAQAKELAKKAPAPAKAPVPPLIPSVQTTAGNTGVVSGSPGVVTTTLDPIAPAKVTADDDPDPDPPAGPDPSVADPAIDDPKGPTVTRTDVTPVTTHDHLDG